jgi:hypothetical protein
MQPTAQRIYVKVSVMHSHCKVLEALTEEQTSVTMLVYSQTNTCMETVAVSAENFKLESK